MLLVCSPERRPDAPTLCRTPLETSDLWRKIRYAHCEFYALVLQLNHYRSYYVCIPGSE